MKDNKEGSRSLNVLIASKNGYVARSDLERAQFQTQVRFMNEFDPEREYKITDVFIGSISYLGHMTEEEFHKDFISSEAPPTEQEPTNEISSEEEPKNES